jgi:two-component system, OmpR family, phosphate regulon sensor histidine kinase PhoR
MRLGFRTRIFLGAAAAAAFALLIAGAVHSTLLALLAGVAVAFAAATVISSAFEEHIAQIEGTAAQSAQRLSEQVTELTIDRARTQALLSGMIEGVLAVDPLGRLQLMNDAARRMLNLEDTALGRPYVEAVRHPVIAQQLAAALQSAHSDPAEVPIANRIFSAQATPASGTGGGAVLVLHDITELRRADRMRRDFVANVSHELRTPLTAIRGYVEALMEEPGTAVQRRTFLGVIDRHTVRMERLVRDLLRLARLDAQQETAERHACEVGPLFKAVVADLAPLIERQHVQIELAVEQDASVAQFDPIKLHDALRNLVENAVNYSPEGGRVKLAARIDDGNVALSVSDEGPGLPESDLERVFERFYRVDKSRTGDPGGTGLGLSIVRHLVELQGGRTQARNKPAGGAVFTILLPK